jgi:hypothetical protein
VEHSSCDVVKVDVSGFCGGYDTVSLEGGTVVQAVSVFRQDFMVL